MAKKRSVHPPTHYVKVPPPGKRVPILISIPHCGTAFPEDLARDFNPDLIKAADDTDWYVDQLYAFGPALGATIISAAYSRWVIDLNRHPENKPLYTDGRIITALCPTTTFLGAPLYKDLRTEVGSEQSRSRIQAYYAPFHTTLKGLLEEMKAEFGHVLLWDCHSIRQIVPSIQREKFPDLILGSADGYSAKETLVRLALKNLGSENYSLSHNNPFKGGYITRHYGKPDEGVNALQLEMTKVNYMDDSETKFDPYRAKKMQELLVRTLGSLGDQLIAEKD